MFAGVPTLCLRVQDLSRAIRFSEALGLQADSAREVPGTSAHLSRGSFKLFLMQEFGTDSITFRGTDAFAVEQHLHEQNLSAPGHAKRQEDGGSHWMTEDPDGHGIFFNTHAAEMTTEHRQDLALDVIRGAARDLADLGASQELVRALGEVVQKFGTSVTAQPRQFG